MTPIAAARSFECDVLAPIHLFTAAAKFKGESTWRTHVKRNHLVVNVPSERRDYLDAMAQRAIQTSAHVVERLRLEH